MPNIWKIIITLPKFLIVIIKSRVMFKKIIKDSNLISEEYRYYWLQKQCKYILWIFSIKLIVHNIENWIDKGCLMVVNHQSNIDPALIFYLNDFSKSAPCAFIAKKELEENKKIRSLISLIDVLYLDRDNPRQALDIIQKANELIRIPRTMVIFPEGSRSYSQRMGDFHPGSFKIAQKAHVSILPVSIINSYKIMNKKNKFKGKRYIHVVFHKSIKPETFIIKPTKLISNTIKQIIEKGISKYENFSELQNNEYYQKYRSGLRNNKKI